MSKGSPRVCVRLSEEAGLQLDRLSTQLKLDRSAVIRRALALLFENTHFDAYSVNPENTHQNAYSVKEE